MADLSVVQVCCTTTARPWASNSIPLSSPSTVAHAIYIYSLDLQAIPISTRSTGRIVAQRRHWRARRRCCEVRTSGPTSDLKFSTDIDPWPCVLGWYLNPGRAPRLVLAGRRASSMNIESPVRVSHPRQSASDAPKPRVPVVEPPFVHPQSRAVVCASSASTVTRLWFLDIELPRAHASSPLPDGCASIPVSISFLST